MTGPRNEPTRDRRRALARWRSEHARTRWPHWEPYDALCESLSLDSIRSAEFLRTTWAGKRVEWQVWRRQHVRACGLSLPRCHNGFSLRFQHTRVITAQPEPQNATGKARFPGNVTTPVPPNSGLTTPCAGPDASSRRYGGQGGKDDSDNGVCSLSAPTGATGATGPTP